MDNNIVTEQLPDLTDAEPIEIAKMLVQVLDRKKGRDIKLLRIADHTIIADYFVICGGTSSTNVKALAGEAEYKLTQCGVEPLRMDGYSEGQWIAVDFGSVIVHIMNRENRDFYKLEKLWSEAESIDVSDLILP
ncbi:MAG: ribosome silencing factor [Ruminococcaceae bacterium]|nr:ribosome silencing factor [Oscillospiraceae bacterium]